MTFKISSDNISWALAHINRHGDTDIFPVPVEYKFYNSIKDEVSNRLSEIDLDTREIGPMFKMFSPKHSGGYRAIAQYDPIDSLLLTGFIGEESSKLEMARIPAADKVACAYRIKKEQNGDLFDASKGWKDYQEKSKEIIHLGNITHVVVADIADFYNQISHHRLANVLESSGVDRNKTRTIENIFSAVNGRHHSRGVPIGPSSSIVFAEMCLSDVDQQLLKKGYKFARYVDDYRIFCESEELAGNAIYDLTEYLHVAHRLTLQGNKTYILDVSKFSGAELIDHEEVEAATHIEKINEMLLEKYNPYDEDSKELDDKEKHEALRSAIAELFDLVEKNKPLNIGLARYVLRRSAAKRIRSFYPKLIGSIPFFFPVIKDVFNYIKSVHHESYDVTLSSKVIDTLNAPHLKDVAFCRYWMYDICLNFPNAFSYESILKQMSIEQNSELKDRYLPLFARVYKDKEWVRSKRENWRNQSIWAQRAFVTSISILPEDERNHWLADINCSPEISIALLAKAVRQSPLL